MASAVKREPATAGAALGEAAFAAAWAEGQALTLEQALEEALTIEAVPLVAAQAQSTYRPEEQMPDGLTAREREIAALVARGLTNRQIAAELFISERTAGTHVANILGKLGFTSRAQVAAWAVEHGLTPARPD